MKFFIQGRSIYYYLHKITLEVKYFLIYYIVTITNHLFFYYIIVQEVTVTLDSQFFLLFQDYFRKICMNTHFI